MTSSARAYVSALNKLLSWNARRAEQAATDSVEQNSHSNINSESVAARPMEVVEVSS
jgi:hypothetical protein